MNTNDRRHKGAPFRQRGNGLNEWIIFGQPGQFASVVGADPFRSGWAARPTAPKFSSSRQARKAKDGTLVTEMCGRVRRLEDVVFGCFPPWNGTKRALKTREAKTLQNPMDFSCKTDVFGHPWWCPTTLSVAIGRWEIASQYLSSHR